MTLKFSDKAHRYWLDRKNISGVTTIIKVLDKPALPYWAAKMVATHVADNLDELPSWASMGRDELIEALKRVPWSERDRKARRGTSTHELLDVIVHGGEVEESNQELAALAGSAARLMDDFGLEPIVTEVPVASREHWYAGTVDFIGHVRGLGDDVWALDWKTSTGVYGETALQVGAYARAEFYVDPPDWETEVPLPRVDRIGVVHVMEEVSLLYDLGDPDEAFSEFLAAKSLFDSTKRRAGLVTDPVEVAA